MAKRTVFLLLVEETTDADPPSHNHATYDVEGAAVEEVSRIVETLRPGLAKAKPRGAYELPRRKAGAR